MNLQHAISVQEHVDEGIHRFELPVSNTTVKFCGGVPIEIGP